jgi:hypothetical protein
VKAGVRVEMIHDLLGDSLAALFPGDIDIVEPAAGAVGVQAFVAWTPRSCLEGHSPGKILLETA